MAEFIKTTRSDFVKEVTKKFTDNRVSQFSKYLDTDVTFVTYYPVNLAKSRADLGTDSVMDILGPQSPIRYNKIQGFPIFIKGGLDPSRSFEDGVVNNELELNDITILPFTVVPKEFDHIFIQLPNMVPILLRVNEVRNMTIQSNDFYSVSAHVITFGDNTLNSLEMLVVERYHCVYENIGTQNSCFILEDKYDEAASLNEAIEEMKNIYNSLYFRPDINSYVFNTSFYDDPMLVDPTTDYRQRDLPWRFWGAPGELLTDSFLMSNKFRRRYRVFAVDPMASINVNINSRTVYDLYLTKFIKDSMIFFGGDNYDVTSAIVYEDLIPLTFEADFKRTIWHAVLTKNPNLLMESPYFLIGSIRKEMSSIVLKKYPVPSSICLLTKIKNRCLCGMEEYFSHELLYDIKHGRNSDGSNCECKCEPNADMSYISTTDVINNPTRDFNQPTISAKPYTLEEVKTDESEETEADKVVHALNDIIYNYFNDIQSDIDTDQLMAWLIEPSFLMYEYFPIIIYILKKRFNSYFVKLS